MCQMLGWEDMIYSLDDGWVGNSGMGDDCGLYLNGWRQEGVSGRCRGDGLRWVAGREGRAGQDTREREGCVLDGQVRSEEWLGLQDGRRKLAQRGGRRRRHILIRSEEHV